MHHHIGLAPPATTHHQNPSLPTMATSSAMALGHHVEQGASTCYPSSLLIDPTRVGRRAGPPQRVFRSITSQA